MAGSGMAQAKASVGVRADDNNQQQQQPVEQHCVEQQVAEQQPADQRDTAGNCAAPAAAIPCQECGN